MLIVKWQIIFFQTKVEMVSLGATLNLHIEWPLPDLQKYYKISVSATTHIYWYIHGPT